MKPVWVWLPAAVEPVLAGHFEVAGGLGRFRYAPEYRARPDAVCLDPVNLPFTCRKAPHTESKQSGLFGVFRDACPDGFGLDQLKASTGCELDDPLQQLELGAADGAGALQLCEDISRKVTWRPMPISHLIEAVQALGPGPSAMADLGNEIPNLQTSLGGERPKLTVEHERQWWIAKLSAAGDAPHAVVREFAAMRAAKAAGIDVAEVQFVQAGYHQMLLVRRFDRYVDPQGSLQRLPYASAHTVLGLDASSVRGDPERSYIALALKLHRWIRPDRVNDQRRELFRRMVFNAVCGNGDDHPRNHGVLFREGTWGLSPAFDIAPPAAFSGTLSMAVNRAGRSTVQAKEMLADCTCFGLERSEAIACIEQCLEAFHDAWPKAVADAGMQVTQVPQQQPRLLELDKSP